MKEGGFVYLIVCVDDAMGVSFRGKRQSFDAVLQQRILQICRGRRLWMKAYTFSLFFDMATDGIFVSDDCLEKAGPGEYCFLESSDFKGYEDRIEGIILCRWNRRYPFDKKLCIPGSKDDWSVSVLCEFRGKSHDKITVELWKRKVK